MRQVVAAALLVSCVSSKVPGGVSEIPQTYPREITLTGEDVIVIGDTGTGDSHQYAVAAGMEAFCKVKSCDFGVMLGDNIYPDGVKSASDPQFQDKFEEPYANLDFTFFPSLGNHDYRGSWQAQVLYQSSAWRMPNRYYVIHTPHADFFALDTEHFDKEQQSWLKAGLQASRKPWQILYGHRPVYSSGVHGDTIEMKKMLLPIIKNYGVDLLLSGHDHHLELQKRDGVAFIISGAGGKSRKTRPWEKPLFVKSVPGFAHLDFEGDDIILSFVGQSGNILDRFYMTQR